jgi:hypothetical protein
VSAKREYASIVCLVLIALLWRDPCLAQEPSGEVTGVEVHGNEVVITYNLKGDADAEYEVHLFLISRKRPDVSRELQLVKGHVGNGKFAGTSRRILWNMKEFPDIREGESFIFRISVYTPGIPWYYWAGGGAAVVGTVIYFVSKKPAGNGDGKIVPEVPNPYPPAR